MLQITAHKKAEVIKLPLTSIQQAIQNPSVTALINSGYYIVAVIPVDDEGEPTLFLILSPERQALSLKPLIFSQWIITAVALSVAWLLLS